MKKLYTVLVAIFIGITGIMAQTDVIYDFENEEVGGWGTWGGTLSIVDNPNTVNAVNTSAKVLKFEHDAAWSAVRLDAGDGNTIMEAKPSKITVKVYSEVAMNIQLYLLDGSAAADYQESKAVGLEVWTLLEYDLTSLTEWDFQQLAFQNSEEGVIFFDDISIMYATDDDDTGDDTGDASEVVIADFESGVHPFGTPWDGTLTIVDNPATDAVNSSEKAAFHEGNPWSGLAIWYDLGNAVLPEYTTFQFDVYPVELGGQDGSGIDKTYFKLMANNSISDLPDLDLGVDVYVINEWYTITIDISHIPTDERDWQQIAIQSEAGDYYIDNIKWLLADDDDIGFPTSLPNEVVTLDVRSENGAILINDCVGKSVQVYSITGAIVFDQNANSSKISVTVPKGVYVVVVDNVSAKVLVR